MKRTPRINGRLGLLAIPIVIPALALALSACGTSAPSSSPASSGTSASGDASATQFCGTWQQFKTTLSEMKVILDDIPAPSPSAAPASLILPEMKAINGVFNRLDNVAPPAVSADMAALTSYWSQVVADLQNGTTVAEVEAYIKAHPPSNAGTIKASTQQLANYLTTTCHINMDS